MMDFSEGASTTKRRRTSPIAFLYAIIGIIHIYNRDGIGMSSSVVLYLF
jgi:hypothetical protein